MKKFIIVLTLLLGIITIMNNWLPNLGVIEGRLKPLKNSPNGVSSYSVDKNVESFEYYLGSMDDLKQIGLSLNGDLISEDDEYLHFVFKTKLGFKDDVEFYYDGQVIHFRSESRLGYSDMGLNKKRYYLIREAYEDLLK